MAETFLAFERSKNRGGGTHATLEAGIEYDFPAEVDESLGLMEPGDVPTSDVRAVELAKLASADGLNAFLQFCFRDQSLQSRSGMRTVRFKMLAICHHAFPELLSAEILRGYARAHGKPLSLTRLAKILRVKPSVLRGHWRTFRRQWRFTCHVAPRPRSKARRRASAR